MDRQGKYAASSQVILAVLAVIAALYLLQDDPDSGGRGACARLHAFSHGRFLPPLVSFRSGGRPCPVLAASAGRALRCQPDGRGTRSGPPTRCRRTSSGSPARSAHGSLTCARDQPYLRTVLPEPGTIDRLGDTNSALLIEKLSCRPFRFHYLGRPGLHHPGARDLPAGREPDAHEQGDSILRPDDRRGRESRRDARPRSPGKSAITWWLAP